MAIIQSTRYVCDLCGQEFSQNGYIAKETIPYSPAGEDLTQENSRAVMSMDLCESCAMCLRTVIGKHFCKVIKDGNGAVSVTPRFVTELGVNGITP